MNQASIKHFNKHKSIKSNKNENLNGVALYTTENNYRL
jgi:hypothetical protein